MSGKLESLAEKVEKVLALLDKIKSENASLKRENAKLRSEAAGIRKEYRKLKLGSADQSEAVKSRLVAVLGRLNELESLHQ
jgi:FtsZ-binding cell division protein ZapB